MALLTAQAAGDGLAAVSFAAADAGGDQVLAGAENAGWNADGVWLLVDNASAGAVTVTMSNGPEVAVTAGDIGVVPCNAGYPHLLDISYSDATSVTVAAVKF